MRLLECYIEAFGRLRDFKYTFSEGLNVINEENGFGKTTLSAFIKAMFFGLDDNRKQKLEENDRKHYAPWDGGKFGGWLTIRVGSLSYRIERTFGAKTPQDTYALYDLESGNISYMYSSNIGEELFGIDADGFERTIFLSEKRLTVKNDNKTVSAKLSDLVGYEWDVGALDDAMRELEQRRKYYLKRGGAGRIAEIKEKIAALDNEIIRVRQIIDSLPERESRLSELQGELLRLEDIRRDMLKRASVIGIEKQYLRLKEELSLLEERAKEISLFFPCGAATLVELHHYQSLSREGDLLNESIREKSEKLPGKGEADESERVNSYIKYIEENGTKTRAKVNPVLLFALSVIMAAVGAVLCGSTLAVGITLIFLSIIPLSVGVAIAATPKGDLKGELLNIKAFLDLQGRSYATPDTFLSELIDIRARFEAELQHTKKAREELDALIKRADEIKCEVEAFLSRFKTVTDDPFTEIRQQLLELEMNNRAITKARGELDSFIRENGIDTEKVGRDNENEELHGVSPEELEERIKALRSEITILDRAYKDSLEVTASIDELNERRREYDDELRDATDRYETILKVMDHLARAKDSLTAKYLGKTRERFNEYIALITKESPELFTLSVDFGVKKTEGAATHEEAAYSLGTREAYTIAARLALVDSLYDGESPFILLDDPFCHLDDKRCQLALKVLKKIAQTKQIIYLTCSKSRVI